ncbi:MAG: hypothetical protein Q7R41_14120, partial [Phycisphaerales bacterium]|nr:hypothetical protein [Phycisphaerales bacterium]
TNVGTCDPTICPPCPLTAAISAATIAGRAQDESCTGAAVGGAGIWSSPDQLFRDAKPGECFLIRIGSFPGSRGTSSTTISCDDAPPAPTAEPTVTVKPRVITFSIPDGATLPKTALRVNLTTLHNVIPGYDNGNNLPIPFTLFEGQSMWVGPPVQYVESSADPTTFMASALQCTPYYHDWSTVGLLHVTGEAILPSSSYDVENLAASCQGQETSAECSSGGGSVSAALTIVTGRSGDVVGAPFSKPDFGDISALVSKYQSKPGAPIKARAKLAGNARGLINLASHVGFADIPVDVDGYQGKPYPYKPGKCTGAPTTACKDDTECVDTGPCILCP